MHINMHFRPFSVIAIYLTSFFKSHHFKIKFMARILISFTGKCLPCRDDLVSFLPPMATPKMHFPAALKGPLSPPIQLIGVAVGGESC